MCKSFRQNLGIQISKIRAEKHITQELLALESGISRSHIAMIETGKRDLTISSLFKISRALNVDLQKFFEFDDLEKFKFDIEEFYK